jgi:hypothetical protein
MSRVVLYLLVTGLVLSCKPEIKNIQGSPTLFCNCTNASLAYQLAHTRNSTVVFSPAAAVTNVNQSAGMNDYTNVTFRICETAVATITATNDNGTATKTINLTRVTEPQSLRGSLTPVCTESGFNGWSFEPNTNPDQAESIAADGVISTIVIVVDRPGVFQYLDRVVNVNAGTNTLREFDNMRLFLSSFNFNAALTLDEECAQSGRELPSGRRPPPSFQITINTRCP